MNGLVEYGIAFAAAALLCAAEGLLLLSIFFGALAVRAILHWFGGGFRDSFETEHHDVRSR